jgi:subtilisin family serine protease
MRKTLLLLALTLSTTLGAAETTRYLVATKKAPRVSGLRMVTSASEAAKRDVRTFRNINAFAADLTLEEVAELRRSGAVDVIEPNYERHALGVIDGTFRPGSNAATRFAEQVVPWGVTTVHAAQVWPATHGENVNVAVLDTGISPQHPDLVHAYAGGVHIKNPTAEPIDDHGHGTHVSGTIAAADNAFGVVGVAPGAKIWAVKVLDETGGGTLETVAAGIDWVISKQKEIGGRWVINMSLGSRFGSEVERLAVQNALLANIVVVAAAGNTGTLGMSYPAQYPGVIAVGATNPETKRTSFSAFGPGMSVMAPGLSVPSTMMEGVQTSAEVAYQTAVYDATGVEGSPFETATGRLVDCGGGSVEEIPFNVKGKIAFMRRDGKVRFRDKARNAKEAGAVGVVIVNNDPKVNDVANWTMVFKTCTDGKCEFDPGWENYEFPLTIGIHVPQGQEVEKLLGKTVTIGYRPEIYGNMSGTSMATPHVAATAALLLSLAPDLTAFQVALVLEKTATDMGEEGWDTDSAWGQIDALEAAKYVAPARFGLPPTTPEAPGKRRGSRH